MMSWETLTDIATRSHSRIFGKDCTIVFSNGEIKKSKAILTPHTTNLRDHYSDMKGLALIASIPKYDANDPQFVNEIIIEDKSYGIADYKSEADGFNIYFLAE